MMLIHLTQHTIPWLADISSWGDLSQHGWLWQPPIDWHISALLDTDVFKPVRTFFDNFIKSGQVWAMVIGLVLGYLIRSFTTYG